MSIGRLLVANRGEIALRIIRACRELGIETVAVCSSLESEAPHTRAADQSVTIGAPHRIQGGRRPHRWSGRRR